MVNEVPDLILDQVTEQEYNEAGSKFVTFAPDRKLGDRLALAVEIGIIKWDTPGVSLQIPVTVTEEGPDTGKIDKLPFGVKSDGIWKGKQIYKGLTGEDMPMSEPGADGQKHPKISPATLAGKPAVGIWEWQEGTKGGVPGAEKVQYSKLMDLVAPE